jgi:hypothetical protein
MDRLGHLGRLGRLGHLGHLGCQARMVSLFRVSGVYSMACFQQT